MHAQPFYEIGHFFWGANPFGCNIFWANWDLCTLGKEIYWDVMMFHEDECIGCLDRKWANYHCYFKWQPAAFHRQHNFCYRNALILGTVWLHNSAQVCIMLINLALKLPHWFASARVDSVSKNCQFATMYFYPVNRCVYLNTWFK